MFANRNVPNAFIRIRRTDYIDARITYQGKTFNSILPSFFTRADAIMFLYLMIFVHDYNVENNIKKSVDSPFVNNYNRY